MRFLPGWSAQNDQFSRGRAVPNNDQWRLSAQVPAAARPPAAGLVAGAGAVTAGAVYRVDVHQC